MFPCLAQRCRDKLGFKFQRLTSLVTGDCHTNPKADALGAQKGSQVSRALGYDPLQAPDEAPSPRRAAQQSECSPAALHQGNQPSSSGGVLEAHFSTPLSPGMLSTAKLHL